MRREKTMLNIKDEMKELKNIILYTSFRDLEKEVKDYSLRYTIENYEFSEDKYKGLNKSNDMKIQFLDKLQSKIYSYRDCLNSIFNIEEKEKFLIKNANDFGLTLDENNNIKDFLTTDNDEEYYQYMINRTIDDTFRRFAKDMILKDLPIIRDKEYTEENISKFKKDIKKEFKHYLDTQSPIMEKYKKIIEIAIESESKDYIEQRDFGCETSVKYLKRNIKDLLKKVDFSFTYSDEAYIDKRANQVEREYRKKEKTNLTEVEETKKNKEIDF